LTLARFEVYRAQALQVRYQAGRLKRDVAEPDLQFEDDSDDGLDDDANGG
jgi:hypothetical protein